MAIAGAMTGTNLLAIERLPDDTGELKSEVVIQLGHIVNYGAPIDQSVRVAGIPFVQSPERSVEVAKVLQPKQWLPTGDDPQLAHGLFHSLLISYRGAREEFAPMLKAAGLATRFVTPAPGEAVRVA